MTRPPEPSVWVVVPTYDEAENIERLIETLTGVLERASLQGHVLVVDDGSPDGTGEIVERAARSHSNVHLLRRFAKEGIGPAYIAGFRRALAEGADLVVQMDADLSHDPADLPRLVAAAGTADVVLGSRYVAGGRVANWPLVRRAISRGGSLYARLILRVGVRDLTGGYKCYRRNVLEHLDLGEIAASGYVFQIETTYRALLAGFRVVEIPITFTERAAGTSKMTGAIVREAAWRVPRLRRLRSDAVRDVSTGRSSGESHRRS